MGVIKDQGDAVFRDSVTAGVPASGPNEPAKSEIRSLFSLIDLSLGAAQAGILTAARTIDRDNLYAIEANRDKLIYVNNNNGSSTDPANGVYEYVDGVSRLANGFYRGVTASFQGQIDTVDDKADAATALATTPRPATLADTNRNRVLIADGGYFQGGIADTTGAFQVSLPAGVNDARFSVIEVVIMDTNGRYQITISGSNGASAWDYPVVTFIGSHLLPKPNVRLGRDAANRYCIWIGDTNAGWSYPQVWVKSALFGANVVSELWMGKWNVALVASFANMQTGPISPVAPLSDVNPSFIGTLNGAQFRSPFFQGGLYVGFNAGNNITANSSYNHLFGYEAGKSITTGFNNCLFGLQAGSEITTGSANSAFGMQAGQYITTAQQSCFFGIHAGLSVTTGFGNVVMGAGALEYTTTGEQNTAIGTYAGRGSSGGANITGSRNIFIGQRAGLNVGAGSDQLWIGSIPDTSGTVDNDALIRGDMAAKWIRINGKFAANGKTPVAPTTLPAALPTDGTATNASMATMLNAVRTTLIASGLAL